MPLINNKTSPAVLDIDISFNLSRMEKGPLIVFTCKTMNGTVVGHETCNFGSGCTYCVALLIDRAVMAFCRYDCHWPSTSLQIRQTHQACCEQCPHGGGLHY